MPIPPVRFFSPAAERAAEVNALTASNFAATNPATLGTFSAVLGQVLAALGPLALDTTLTNIGTGTTGNAGGAAGFGNTVFTLLLLNSLGAGQATNTQSVGQQLLVAQLLFNSTDTSDSTGLGTVATEDIASALAQQPGANDTLLAQLSLAATQLNPILFSASGLADAFQLGNDTGAPA